jgi:hypothetical protein
MLNITDLQQVEALSSARMGEVAGALGDIQGNDGDQHKDWSEPTGYTTPAAPVTMATLWNEMFGSIAPV